MAVAVGAAFGLCRALAWAGATGFAYVTLAALFVAAPERTQARLLDASNGRSRGPFYSGAFAYAPLSANLSALAPSIRRSC